MISDCREKRKGYINYIHEQLLAKLFGHLQKHFTRVIFQILPIYIVKHVKVFYALSVHISSCVLRRKIFLFFFFFPPVIVPQPKFMDLLIRSGRQNR